MTNFLTLRGIYPNEFVIEDVAVESRPDTNLYTEMPRRFESPDKWIKFSNLRCWYCDQMPSGYPRFVPLNLERVGGGIACDTHGHFDDWNCAVSWIEREFPQEARWDLKQSVCILEAEFTGKRRARVSPALPKTLMRQYGGDLTPQQYREKNAQIDREG